LPIFGTNIPGEICNKIHLYIYSLPHVVLCAETILCKTSQTDSTPTYAPAHRARETVALWSTPNSLDPSPVDCKVWVVMREQVYCTPILDVADVKRRQLIAARSALQQHVIDEAIDQWRGRLYACVGADRRHTHIHAYIHKHLCSAKIIGRI